MKEKEFYSLVELRDEWAFAHLGRAETNEVTHSYHKYPAKFIPQLARALIKGYTHKGDVVWDPFCGSGTLNLEAFRTFRHSIGTDVNPVAVLISRAKTNPLEPEELGFYNQTIIEALRNSVIQSESFYISRGTLNGNIQMLKKWFPNESLIELGHILWQIEENTSKKKYREFALCAFSAILKRSSYWLNSSVKSQIDPDKKPKQPLFYFEKQLKRMEKTNKLFYEEAKNNKTQVHIFKHNAKHRLPSGIQKIDCIITSPPYVVSYDYSDIFRLSTYFLFYQPGYAQFRQTFIGTTLRRKNQRRFSLPNACHSVINSINDTAVQRNLNEYYKDMGEYFKNMRNHLAKSGRLIMVVGDTELRNVKIPNAYLQSKIATETGWHLEKAYARDIPVKILPTYRDIITGKFTNKESPMHSERYNREYVLIFQGKTK